MLKKVLGSVVFVVIFTVIFSYLNNTIYWTSWARYAYEPYAVAIGQMYEQQNRNKYDVVFIGSSHAGCTFYPKIFWEQHGFSSYVFTSSGQELYVSEYFLKETLKVQQPKVVVLEVIGAAMGVAFRTTLNNEPSKTTSYSFSPLSLDKLYTLNNAFDQLPFVERFEPMFPFITFHESWETMSFTDFSPINVEQYRYNNGAMLFNARFGEFEQPSYITTEKLDFHTKSKQSLYNIIEICSENDIELVLVSAPYAIEQDTQKVINSVAEIANQNDVPFINYNRLYEQTGIDFSTDFFDADHLNVAGMEKISTHFGEYLSQNYDLPDRRGEEGFEDFELAGQKEYFREQ